LYNRSKILALAVLLCLPLGLLSLPQGIQQNEEINREPAKFIISEWVNDDGYGQGISGIYMHQNSTGSWLPFTSPAFLYSTDPNVVTVNVSDCALRVGPTFTLNHSLHSLANIAAGLNIIRSNVSVYNMEVLIFSSDNITMVSGGNQIPTTYWYYAYAEFDFLIVAGEIYMVTITYEVYY